MDFSETELSSHFIYRVGMSFEASSYLDTNRTICVKAIYNYFSVRQETNFGHITTLVKPICSWIFLSPKDPCFINLINFMMQFLLSATWKRKFALFATIGIIENAGGKHMCLVESKQNRLQFFKFSKWPSMEGSEQLT